MDLSGFQFFTGSTLRAAGRDLPDRRAAYVVFIRAGDRILETSGYFGMDTRLPWRLGEFFHLYTGASCTWGTRVRQHLTGEIANSTLRRTLVALELEAHAISKAGLGLCDLAADRALTAWLAANAIFGVLETQSPFEVESEIIAAEPTPLNIDRRRDAPYAQVLVGARNAHFPKHRPVCRNGIGRPVSNRGGGLGFRLRPKPNSASDVNIGSHREVYRQCQQ